MNEKDLTEMLSQIRSQYGSLETPNFSFVNEAISGRPYEEVIAEIGKYFTVEEDTDPNNDVSFGYFIVRNRQQWILRLSMIGPYAMLLRQNGVEKYQVLSTTLEDLTGFEKQIIEVISEKGINLLDREAMSKPIAIRLFNTKEENARVYQALFTDSDVLPWEGWKS
jgi:hypothetical protein